ARPGNAGRRPAPTARSSWSARRPTSTPSWRRPGAGSGTIHQVMTPQTAHPPVAPAPMHACVRCGAPVAVDVGLCERCNPLGLRDSSASQVHGLAIGGVFAAVIILAIFARLSVSGVGPFVATAVATPDGTGLAVALSVTNQ